MTHTPGPWSVFYKHKYNEWHVSVPAANGSMKLAIAADGIQTDNPEGDARLIAAAPDLLAALKRLELDWDGEPEDIFEAREAIAKAEAAS